MSFLPFSFAPPSECYDHRRYFTDSLGISEQLLERCLGEALGAGADFADIYFEAVSSNSLGVDEGIVTTAKQGISIGGSVRVIAGERIGLAYTDDLSPESLVKTARTAALIASGPRAQRVQRLRHVRSPQLYPLIGGITDDMVALKLALIERADKAARAFDARVIKVRASLNDELRRILIASSDGTLAADTQPLVRFNIFVIAKDKHTATRGTCGGGGRVTLDFFQGPRGPEHFACEAVRVAILQLDAIASPVGEMEVVLGPGWPGILVHESVGHGLEADFNRKKTSAFTGLIGQKVASDRVTVVDNGTIPGRRGSLNIDDEGNLTQETVLIEEGVLRSYLSDKINAKLMGIPNTGSGRRESYRAIPLPRMTNTYMLPGQDDPIDIIRSVKRGLYAPNFGAGQVDITSGKFDFSASEAYLIEDGRVTRPVRGATLVGSGPEVLKQISMVGNDLALDEGIGTCGKSGQSVPIGVGLPTVKLNRMMVGGTDKNI